MGINPELENVQVIKRNLATKVLLIKVGDKFLVVVEDEVVTETRALGLAEVDYDDAVNERSVHIRQRLAKERAARDFIDLTMENDALRASRARRGGKGGRGGV